MEIESNAADRDISTPQLVVDFLKYIKHEEKASDSAVC